MVTPQHLFRMLNELILVLLGALLLGLAASGRYFFDPQAAGVAGTRSGLDRVGSARLDAERALRNGGRDAPWTQFAAHRWRPSAR